MGVGGAEGGKPKTCSILWARFEEKITSRGPDPPFLKESMRKTGLGRGGGDYGEKYTIDYR